MLQERGFVRPAQCFNSVKIFYSVLCKNVAGGKKKKRSYATQNVKKSKNLSTPTQPG